MFEVFDAFNSSNGRVGTSEGNEEFDDDLGRVLEESVLDLLSHFGARVGGSCCRPATESKPFLIFIYNQ